MSSRSRHPQTRARHPGPILIVSHEASRTGAPRVAVDILRALQPMDTRTVVVHRWGGPMRDELDRAADGSAVEPLRHLRVILRRWRATRGWALAVERMGASLVLRRLEPSLVWCNTVLSAAYVRPAQRRRIPVVLHGHELRPLVGSVLGRYGLTSAHGRSLPAGVHLAACSDEAANALGETVGVEPSSIAMLPSPVDVAEVRRRGHGSMLDPRRAHGRLRIVACARGDKRKGLDLFISLAAALEKAQPKKYQCLWVGRIEEPSLLKGYRSIECLGEVADPVPILASADIFVLTSRTDAFPLVVLEAMALERPVVAFAVGGVPQQLGDTGVLVEPENVSAMADEVLRLGCDPEHRKNLGALELQRVAELWDFPAFASQVRRLAEGALAEAQ